MLIIYFYFFHFLFTAAGMACSLHGAWSEWPAEISMLQCGVKCSGSARHSPGPAGQRTAISWRTTLLSGEHHHHHTPASGAEPPPPDPGTNFTLLSLLECFVLSVWPNLTTVKLSILLRFSIDVCFNIDMCLFPGSTVSGWCHGVSSQQHTTQLAGGTFCPSDHWEGWGRWGDGAERTTQLGLVVFLHELINVATNVGV